MKYDFYVLLTIGSWPSGMCKHDYCLIHANRCIRIDSSTLLIDDSVQMTFHEVSIDEIRVTPFPPNYFNPNL